MHNRSTRTQPFGLLVLRCVLATVLIFLITRTWADPDLWGHVLFGRDIVRTGSVPSIDTYAFTSDKAWINHEWLAEGAMYLAYAAGGNGGLIVLKTALMLAALVAVLVALRPAALAPAVHDLLMFMVFAGTFTRAHAFRPQVFSIAMYAALLLVLVLTDRGKFKPLFLVPLLFALWPNLHGGWIVGMAVFGLWVALKLTTAKEAFPHTRATLLAVGAAAVAATLVNPYGWKMWEFLVSTVRFERAEISDWQPIWQLPVVGWVPWLATAVLAAFCLSRTGRVSLRAASIVTVCCAASVVVGRLDMFFVLSTVMLLGPALGAVETTAPATGEHGSPSLRAQVAALSGIAVIVLAIVVSQPRSSCVVIDGTWQPEADVVNLVRERQMRGRMITFFDWGEYAIWHLTPHIKVSFDGRRETVYSDAVVSQHLLVYSTRPEAPRAVASLNADLVWLPAGTPVLNHLEQLGWHRVFAGPTSTLLSSDPTTASPSTVTGPIASRCFPGP